jgi:hypothetical protein
LAVIADTGREASETWEYLDAHIQPLLKTVNLEVEVAPHSLATVGLYGKNGDLLIPAFTANGGKLPTFCSNEWKKRVIQRYLRSRDYGPTNPTRVWLGISVDEGHRGKPSGVPWAEYHWPLLFDIPMRRDECKRLVESAGLPSPPRSSCWMCPHRNNQEWRNLRENFPDDWQQAIDLEAEIRSRDDGVWLHRTMEELPAAQIDDENHDLFDGCDSGYCFV